MPNDYFYDFYFLTHPDNLKILEKAVKDTKRQQSNQFFSMYDYNSIEIRTDVNLPRFAQKWQFPVTPFVEYEENKDRAWAEPIGFGRLVDTTEPLFYKITKNRMVWDCYTSVPILKPNNYIFGF